MKLPLFKIFFSLTVFIYVFSTIGVSMVAHYCGGELEKVSLFSASNSCCGGEEEDAGDCCKNDSKYVAFQSDFTFYTIVSDCKSSLTYLFIIQPFFIYKALQAITQFHFLDYEKNHPPNLVQKGLVSLSVIRI